MMTMMMMARVSGFSKLRVIRASVDALCRDEQGQISRDSRTKRLVTRRESLAKPSKHASNSAFAHL